MSKNIVLQWGELPTSVAYIGTGQIMGWGNKAIEIRSVASGHLDGVFMHKKAQRLKFLCERNDKVSCQILKSSQRKFYRLSLSSFFPGIFQLGQGWVLMPNLLHDPEQARNGQLVKPAKKSDTFFLLETMQCVLRTCVRTTTYYYLQYHYYYYV